MRSRRVLSSVLLLLPALSSGAEPLIRISPAASADTFSTIDIQELWSSTQPVNALGGNVTVQFRLFDREYRPQQANLWGCGWMLVGTGDLGITPVGIRVWTKTHCDLQVLAEKKGALGADELFKVTVDSESFELRVTADGKVSLAGHPVGVIKD